MANTNDPIQTAKDILERVKTKNVEESKTMTKEMEKVREMMTTRKAEKSDIEETLEKMAKMTEEEIKELLKKESDLADETNEAKIDEIDVHSGQPKNEDELEEAETIIDVDDAEVPGAKATEPPKGKKKMKEPKMSASDASGKIDTPKMRSMLMLSSVVKNFLKSLEPRQLLSLKQPFQNESTQSMKNYTQSTQRSSMRPSKLPKKSSLRNSMIISVMS